MENLLSRRSSVEIEAIYAVVVRDAAGVEGVVRRDTIAGTQPWITDDDAMARVLLREAKRASGFNDAYLVRFIRADVVAVQ
jgi:hypothetical protein